MNAAEPHGRFDVRLLHAREIGSAVTLLSRAFDDDLIIAHFLNEPRRRRMAYALFFRTLLLQHRRGGHVYAALSSGHIVGVAVWRAPGADATTSADRRRWRLAEWVMRLLFPGRARQLFAGFASAEQFQPKQNLWYLAFLGVDPAFQNQGVGRQLLAPVLERAAREGLSCYLETPTRKNQPFYERLGFEVVTELHPFAGGLPLWPMLRVPRRTID